MSSLERLPPDQRAVLALVLQRGRSYDEIASLLAIDRAAVRDRALAALDALGPSEPSIPPERRALITDYLLGQLPARVRDDTRERLASSPSERAWARLLAGELGPISSQALPEIPAGAPAAEPEPEPAAATPAPEPTTEPEPITEAEIPAATELSPATTGDPARGGTPPAQTPPSSSGRMPRPVPGQRSSSRVGGGALLAIAAVIAIVVVVVILVNNNSSSSPPKSRATHKTTTGTTTTTGTSTTATHVIATIIMKPTSKSSKAGGAAEVVTQGKLTGVIVAAQHLAPNTTHNAYAVWLTAPGGASHLLGYVSPGVGKAGTLKTSGPLPSNVASYNKILITLETTTNTKTPGPTVLQGTL